MRREIAVSIFASRCETSRPEAGSARRTSIGAPSPSCERARPTPRDLLERQAQRLGVGELAVEQAERRAQRGQLAVGELDRPQVVVLGRQRVELGLEEALGGLLDLKRDAEALELGAVGVEAPGERVLVHRAVALDLPLDLERRDRAAVGHEERDQRELADQLFGVLGHGHLSLVRGRLASRFPMRFPHFPPPSGPLLACWETAAAVIGAGTIISPIIKIVTTVAILGGDLLLHRRSRSSTRRRTTVEQRAVAAPPRRSSRPTPTRRRPSIEATRSARPSLRARPDPGGLAAMARGGEGRAARASRTPAKDIAQARSAARRSARGSPAASSRPQLRRLLREEPGCPGPSGDARRRGSADASSGPGTSREAMSECRRWPTSSCSVRVPLARQRGGFDMIGAGTIISPIIKIVTTVAILAAVYFFIVKPTLDTTEKAITNGAGFESARRSPTPWRPNVAGLDPRGTEAPEQGAEGLVGPDQGGLEAPRLHQRRRPATSTRSRPATRSSRPSPGAPAQGRRTSRGRSPMRSPRSSSAIALISSPDSSKSKTLEVLRDPLGGRPTSGSRRCRAGGASAAPPGPASSRAAAAIRSITSSSRSSALGQRAPRLGEDAALGVERAQLRLLEVGVELDLVHRRDHVRSRRPAGRGARR